MTFLLFIIIKKLKELRMIETYRPENAPNLSRKFIN